MKNNLESLEKSFLTITEKRYDEFKYSLEFSCPNDKCYQAIEALRSKLGDTCRTDYWAPDMQTTKITLYFKDGSEKTFYEGEKTALKYLIEKLKGA